MGESMTIVRRNFTWPEFVAGVRENVQHLPRSHVEGSAWHYGTDGPLGDTGHIDETLRVAEGEGWLAAIPAADQLMTHIETDLGEAMHNQFVNVYDVAGSEVDMGRYLSGEPECMTESVPMKVLSTGRVIKLAVPVCYMSTIHADTVKARGAAVMALVNAFAMKGHPVEIYAVMAIHGKAYGQRKDRRLVYTIKVQDADQVLNMGRIMYALAHPTMLRQLCFALEHGEDDKVRSTFRIGSGYGGPSYAAEFDDLDINIENAIILPELRGNSGWSEPEAVAWINKQLEMLNGDE